MFAPEPVSFIFGQMCVTHCQLRFQSEWPFYCIWPLNLWSCCTSYLNPRVNITGAIDLKTMSVLTRDYETINGESTVDFLKAIERANPTAIKIHLIADGGQAHTCHEVSLYLSQPNAFNRDYLKNKHGIELPSNNSVITK